MTPDVCGLVS